MFGLGGQHIGLIKGASSSEIVTIEGNYGDAVAARRIRWRGAGLWFAPTLMPFTSREYWATLANSLRDQGYRRVLLEGIDPDVRLSTGDAQLDSALVKSKAAGARLGGDPRQLLQFQGLSGFQFTCVRRDKHDIEVICVYAWNGQLSLNTAVTRANHVSVIMTQLGKIVNQFSLADETRALLESAINDAADADAGTAPTTPPAASPALANDPNLDASPVGPPIARCRRPGSERAVIEEIGVGSTSSRLGLLYGRDGQWRLPSRGWRWARSGHDREAESRIAPVCASYRRLDCIEKMIHGETTTPRSRLTASTSAIRAT